MAGMRAKEIGMANKGIVVLLVDDEARFRASTEKVLGRRGYKVISAADGQEAIQKMAEKPDVVILDIKMPGMDGLEVLIELKKVDYKIPVIMLTGHGSLDKAEQALSEGAYDFLAKPCDMDILAAKINEAHRHREGGVPVRESLASDVMIPLEDYTSLSQDSTVKEAIAKLHQSFTTRGGAPSIMETGHRSVLVTGDGGKVIGILSILELLGGLMPAYLTYPKPSTADAIQYSPIFWRGLFTRELKKLGEKKISLLMSPAPSRIEASASLLEAGYALVQNGERRLLVVQNGKPVGVLREQDLFFEMERTLFR